MSNPPRRSQVIPVNQYRRVPWRNGAGWTREIHAHGDARDNDWDWRLSIAGIEQDAPFSTFPGVDRELVLLSGEGLRLRFDDDETRLVEPPHGHCRFAGERAVTGELVDGRTEDFNVMWRRDRYVVDVLHRPLAGAMVLFADARETCALHLLGGHARFDSDCGLPPLQAGDTALLAEPRRTLFLVDGDGDALLVHLRRIDQAVRQ